MSARSFTVPPRSDSAYEIDSRVAGRTPDSDALLIFSTMNHAAPSYVRNGLCWGADLDLTCVSPWNSGNAHLWAGTLITPRHIVHAQHAFVADGATIRFITRNNVIVTRTVVSGAQVGATDIRISVLDSDVPATIQPAKLLPLDWASHIVLGTDAVAYTDQEEKLLSATFTDLDATGFEITDPLTGSRGDFHDPPVVGDSGNPVFVVARGQIIVVGCFTSVSGNSAFGPTLVGNNLAGVLAAVAALGTHTHVPQHATLTPSLSAFTRQISGGSSFSSR